MAEQKHVDVLREGVFSWNRWRFDNPDIRPDLINMGHFKGDLKHANMSGVDLTSTCLMGQNLYKTDFTDAILNDVTLSQARLIETNFKNADLTGSRVYGVSAWKVNLENTIQKFLVISDSWEPIITVDNLELAQFIYLLLNNNKIRDVIDTITSKVVLILGRFTETRKQVLDAIREKLHSYDYVPVLFDFCKPNSRDFIETVSTLARFVIADVTESKLIIEEIPHIVRNLAVPVKPLLLKGSGDPPLTLYNLRINHRSLLETYIYENTEDLIFSLNDKVIMPSEKAAKELVRRVYS